MRKLGYDGESIYFRCDACGAEHAAPRCVGENRFGAQCLKVAQSGHETCPQHRPAAEAVAS